MPHLIAADLACLRGGRLVFDQMAFDLSDGDALVLTGANGSGKSSLIRILAGLSRPFAGSLTWNGTCVLVDPDPYRRQVAVLGHLDGVKAALTLQENILFWARMAGISAPLPLVTRALTALNLEALADRPGRFLSAGQRRRAGMARVIAMARPIWLLDEPTIGLDRSSVDIVCQLIADHRRQGGLVVVSTHLPLDVPHAATRDLVSAS